MIIAPISARPMGMSALKCFIGILRRGWPHCHRPGSTCVHVCLNRWEVWKGDVPPRIFFSARVGGDAADTGGKGEYSGRLRLPEPHHRVSSVAKVIPMTVRL